MLIRDIKAIFEEKATPEKISSGDLVDTLNLVETSPWGDYRKGKGVSTQWLAKSLKPFGITPRHFNKGNGYSHEAFKDTFSRYIPRFQHSPIFPLKIK